jgi:ferric-dicitrate binding protein FerR (iron transport regulator)
LILTKNEAGAFFINDNKLEKSADPSLNSLAWHTRRLVFQNTPLKDALQAIEGLYGVKVEAENNAILNCPLTATFDQKSMEGVLATLQALLGADVEKNAEGRYLLKGGRCE